MQRYLSIAAVTATVLFYALAIPCSCFGESDAAISDKGNPSSAVNAGQDQLAPPFEIVQVKPRRQVPGDRVTIELYYPPAEKISQVDISVTFDAIAAEISDFNQAKTSILFRVKVPYDLTESNQPPEIDVRIFDNRVRFKGDFELILSGKTDQPPWWQIWYASPVQQYIIAAIFAALFSFGVYLIRRRMRKKRGKRIAPETIAEKAIAHPSPEETAPLLPLPSAPDTLKAAIAGGKCILVFGSGMNAQGGLITWQEMLRRVVIKALGNKDGAFYLQELDNGLVDSVAESLRSVLGADKLAKHLMELIPHRFKRASPYTALRDLGFAGVVNLNYDTLATEAIAQATVSSHTQARKILDQLSRGERFMLQLNGTGDGDDLLFSNQDLRDALSHNEALGELLQRLYYSYTLLFLGVSLEGVKAFYRLIERTSQVANDHYALLEVDNHSFTHRARILENFQVRVLPFSVADRDTVMTYFINSLSGAAAGDDAKRPDPKITRLELRNIGPFEHEVLEFDPSWNILLGDNCVGKSTILKAIAICVCGRESERYAERVLRQGAMSGEITLDIGERSYITRIKQQSGPGVLVESMSGVPYKLEGMLFAGFSALRAIGWERPSDSGKPGAARPMAEDIMPVISGERDPRLEGVKQLILRLHHSVGSKDTPAADRRRYQALYDRLFDMLRELAHGVKIERGPVDAQASKISVVTEDGTVPFEALSQGALSLAGWTCALLQRLFEVAREGQDPTKATAIVIIDEIDAHMHPAWQRTLASRLSKLFPNIQFIATSHSPLMVSSLEPSQVYRLARDASGRVFKERPDYALKGLGVAGLLTSNLFGLDSPLDEVTEGMLNRKRKLVAKVMSKTITPEEETELGKIDEQVSQIDTMHSLRDQAFRKLKPCDAEDDRANDFDLDDELTVEEKATQERILNETLLKLTEKDVKR